MDFANLSNTLVSLLTLTFLEIILGVDNLVFISITSQRLPIEQQKSARRLGLTVAWVTRLILLASAVWIAGLTKALFTIYGWSVSGRDLLLLCGGLFLIYKATQEIHQEIEPETDHSDIKKASKFALVILQIGILDLVFSLDSVITAIGLTQQFWVMAVAITIAVILMIVASEPLSRFVNKHSTIRMLALSFLILIGVVLVADGLQFHIPRGYIYFAIFFSVSVESLNLIRRQRNDSTKHN